MPLGFLLLFQLLICSADLRAQAAAQPTLESVKARIAAYPPDLQVYSLFRFWLTGEKPEVQKLFEKPESAPKGFELYGKVLRSQGDTATEVERKVQLLQSRREDLEIELWNQILTSDSPRLNREPNAFLVRMAKGRQPGRALDVGMGQGRNTIWLAQQGWETTGFDPAARAVEAAREAAGKLGLKMNTVVAKDSDFDMGDGRWDLIVLSYVDMRHLASRVVKALAPGGMVIAEYFHEESAGVAGGFADNELMNLFPGLRVVHYEDTEGLADFGKTKDRLVRLAAEKRRP